MLGSTVENLEHIEKNQAHQKNTAVLESIKIEKNSSSEEQIVISSGSVSPQFSKK